MDVYAYTSSCMDCFSKKNFTKVIYYYEGLIMYFSTCIHNLMCLSNDLPKKIEILINGIYVEINNKSELFRNILIKLFDSKFGNQLKENYIKHQDLYFKNIKDQMVLQLKFRPNSNYLKNIVNNW